MLTKVQNAAALATPSVNHLLMVAYRTVNPIEKKEPGTRCRFDLFVRMRPGISSNFTDQKRSWCYRGDKYTDEPHRMLRNLLKLVQKKFPLYDRVILYDNDAPIECREILRIIDDNIEKNRLNQYSLMLLNFHLPEFLTIPV